MKITKYGHACLVIEEKGKKLIVDPGGFTTDFGDVSNVAAVVITHVHMDHFDPDHLQRIFAKNPDAKFFTTAEVAKQANAGEPQVANPGESVTVGPFKLQFFGELHANIMDIMPRNQNIGVLVNDALYYGGDSYTLPKLPVHMLAVPTSAPWLKMSDVADYIKAVKPKHCFPTHDGLLNDRGHALMHRLISLMCEAEKITFTSLKPGESTEI